MDMIVAILFWIGVVEPGQAITTSELNYKIEANQSEIQYYSNQEMFLDVYNANRTVDHIGMLDLNEGD